MLEHPALWIGPPPPSVTTGVSLKNAPRWHVCDPTTHSFLGLIRSRTRWTSRWLRWLDPPVLDVYESGDESLLFTMRRSWAASDTWRVADAEGRPVADLSGTEVRSWEGELLAVVEMLGAGRGRWVSLTAELGHFRPENQGLAASFTADLEEKNPFVKMALLATLLRMLLASG